MDWIENSGKLILDPRVQWNLKENKCDNPSMWAIVTFTGEYMLNTKMWFAGAFAQLGYHETPPRVLFIEVCILVTSLDHANKVERKFGENCTKPPTFTELLSKW